MSSATTKTVVQPDTLFVTISQSGETADTLAALRAAKKATTSAAWWCNARIFAGARVRRRPDDPKPVPRSVLLTRLHHPAGGTAPVNAGAGQRLGLSTAQENAWVEELRALPRQVEVVLKLQRRHRGDGQLVPADIQNALFPGRGTFYPSRLEAPEAQEISYIHAEAYPAGELKHGRWRWSTSADAGGLRAA